MLAKEEIEFVLRTFFCCPKVHAFWDEVTVMLNSQGITFKSLDVKDILFVFLTPVIMTVTESF